MTLNKYFPDLCVYPYKRAGKSGCFHIHTDKMLSWNDARSVCKDLQGDLATPMDFVEFKDFLTKLKRKIEIILNNIVF